MMTLCIRKAVDTDIERIAQSYEELLTYEQEHGSNSNWQLGLYPTAAVPTRHIPKGSMYVLEEDGELCASMVLNQDQAKEYATIPWLWEAQPHQVMVIHTLCIPPSKAGHGYGTKMINFAKQTAKEAGCVVLRIDTYIHNEPARRLYLKNGFRLAGSCETYLEGVIPEELIYLEHRLENEGC